jgi:DNA-binding CsgD family transcriptional regulator
MHEHEAPADKPTRKTYNIILLIAACLGFALLWFARTFFSPFYLDGMSDPVFGFQLLTTLPPLLVSLLFFGQARFSNAIFFVALGIQVCSWISMVFFPELYDMFFFFNSFSLCVFTIMFLQFFCQFGLRITSICLPTSFALAHLVAALTYLLPDFDATVLHTILLVVSLALLGPCIARGELINTRFKLRQLLHSPVELANQFRAYTTSHTTPRFDSRRIARWLHFGAGLILFPFFLGISFPIGSLSGIYEGVFAFIAELVCVLVLQTLLIVIILTRSKIPNPDILLTISLVAMLGALLLMPFTYHQAVAIPIAVSSSIIKVGYVFYLAVLWLLLTQMTQHKPEAAISLFAVAIFANAFFVMLGEQLGNSLITFSLSEFDMVIRVALICTWLALMCLLAFSAIMLRQRQPARSGSENASLPPATPFVSLEKRSAELTSLHGLTPRESQIIVELIHGKNLAAIGESLCISTNTVRTHVQHLYAKLKVHNRQELLDLLEDDARSKNK